MTDQPVFKVGPVKPSEFEVARQISFLISELSAAIGRGRDAGLTVRVEYCYDENDGSRVLVRVVDGEKF